MYIPYGNNFSATAALELAGKCHTLSIGDSQSTPVLDYLWYDTWPRVCPQRYHYFCVSGANSAQSLTNNFGVATGNGSTVDAGSSRAETGYVHSVAITSNSAANPTVVTFAANHGYQSGETITIAGQSGTVDINGSRVITVTGATTGTVPVNCLAGGGTGGTGSINVSSYSLGPVRMNRFTADIAANTINTANFIMMPRQIASTPAHTNGQRTSAWPTFVSNSSQPWFHGTYMKGKVVLWKDSSTLDKFAIYLRRAGHTTNNDNLATKTQVDVSAATTGPIASGWTDVLTDLTTYDSSTNGIVNDHEVAIRMYSSSAVYDETGKTIIPLGAIFARCNSGGAIPWNADNSGCGYDAIGRSGCYVSDWLNYATQAQWQAYFTATVLVPDYRTKIRIMLGHNVNPSGSDVGDGDGSQVEQSGSPGIPTSYWKKRYKAFIARLQAAYAAAFPTGALSIELIVPWKSGQNSFMADSTSAAALNTVVKEIAAETGASWFSFYDYFNGSPPFYNLHAWTPYNGQMLAMALRDGMDRATDYQYATSGRVDTSGARNRSWR